MALQDNSSKLIKLLKSAWKARFTQDHSNAEVYSIQGKLMSIVQRDKDNNDVILDEPKIIVGKSKGLLATLGLIKQHKFISIVNNNGQVINDQKYVKEIMSQLREYRLYDANTAVMTTIDTDGNVPKDFKVDLLDRIYVYKNSNEVASTEHNGIFHDQHPHEPHKRLYIVHNKEYMLSDPIINAMIQECAAAHGANHRLHSTKEPKSFGQQLEVHLNIANTLIAEHTIKDAYGRHVLVEGIYHDNITKQTGKNVSSEAISAAITIGKELKLKHVQHSKIPNNNLPKSKQNQSHSFAK